MKRASKSVRWEGIITNIQASILTNLATYKFLTISQLLQCGTGTTQRTYLWKQIASLRDRKTPLVKCQKFNVTLTTNPPQKMEDWYYLTNAGKRALAEDLQYVGEIKLPIGRSSLPSKDYLHRKQAITFFIYLHNWAKESKAIIPFFDTYFDKTGNNRTNKNLCAKTRIDFDKGDFFIPDGAFGVNFQSKNKFFLMEMYDGNDVGRTIGQLTKHAVALTNRFTHRAYKLSLEKSYNIILIFQYESLMKSTIQRIKSKVSSFQVIQQYFRCKNIDQLSEGLFFEGWQNLHGETVNLFGPLKIRSIGMEMIECINSQ